MKYIIKTRTMFILSCICFLINAATILVMEKANEIADQTNRISLVVTSVVFWMFLIYAILFFMTSYKTCKRYIDYKYARSIRDVGRPGIVCFFSNIPATVADTMLIGCIIVLIAMIVMKISNMYISYVVLFLLLFSFNMHYMLNSRIFKVLRNKEEEKLNEAA